MSAPVPDMVSRFRVHLATPEGKADVLEFAGVGYRIIQKLFGVDEALARKVDIAYLVERYEAIRASDRVVQRTTPLAEKVGERIEFYCGFCGAGFTSHEEGHRHEGNAHCDMMIDRVNRKTGS